MKSGRCGLLDLNVVILNRSFDGHASASVSADRATVHEWSGEGNARSSREG